MPGNKNKTHLIYWITWGLVLSFLISLIGAFFPYQSTAQTLLFKTDGLCAISAFACLGAKATTEGYDVAGAGFNILAISQGLFLTQIDQPGHWNYEAAMTAVLFMIPSSVMISYYAKFPKWLRVAGIITTIPFLILAILNYSVRFSSHIFENIIYLVYQVITLCWAWSTWKERDN